MNKSEFVNYIAAKNNCTKVEAEKVIDIFTRELPIEIRQEINTSVSQYKLITLSNLHSSMQSKILTNRKNLLEHIKYIANNEHTYRFYSYKIQNIYKNKYKIIISI